MVPLKYMNLEVGDIVNFDKVLGDVLPYGIDYTKFLSGSIFLFYFILKLDCLNSILKRGDTE